MGTHLGRGASLLQGTIQTLITLIHQFSGAVFIYWEVGRNQENVEDINVRLKLGYELKRRKGITLAGNQTFGHFKRARSEYDEFHSLCLQV